MQFISVKDGKFEVTDEARVLLSGSWADIRLSIVSVVGTYRIGKSSLLNWLTNKIDLFPTSDEVHAQTRGLWMAKELCNDSILYIDSEGLSNVEVSTAYDFKIFALCIALSSKLIVNSGHVLKSNELTELKEAGKVAAFLSSNTSIKNGNPDLLWLFRNSQLKITDQETKEPMSATKYLETSLLKLDPDLSSSLLGLFPKRHAIALPKPSTIDIDIKNQNFRNFSPAFKNAFDLVKQEVEQQTHSKQIGEVFVTGSLFLNMADKLCAILSSNEIPTDISYVYEALCNETRSKIDLNVQNQTRKFIATKDKKRSLFNQEDICIGFPSFIIKNLKQLMLEDPTLDKISELLEICLKTIRDQEKSQFSTFSSGLIKSLKHPNMDIDSIIRAFIGYFTSSSNCLEIFKWVQEKSIHMQTEKWDLLQQDLIQKDLAIESKQKELNDINLNIEQLEEVIKISQEDKQSDSILIERLKSEMGLLTTRILEKENEYNQLRIELHASNESVEQYMMVIQELKTKFKMKNEDKTKLEQANSKYQILLKELEDLQQFSKKQALELESKKQLIDESQEKLTNLTRDFNKRIEFLHIDIINEKARCSREEERSAKKMKLYQDASAQHTIDMNELQSLRHQKLSDTAKIAELTGSLLAAKRMQNFHELVKNF